MAGLRRLCLVRPKEEVLKSCAVETANDGGHLLRVRRVDEGEPFRFLCFRVADDFDIVENKALGIQPSLDVIFRDPDGEVSEEDSKAHSFGVVAPLSEVLGICFADAIHESYLMLAHASKCAKGKIRVSASKETRRKLEDSCD